MDKLTSARKEKLEQAIDILRNIGRELVVKDVHLSSQAYSAAKLIQEATSYSPVED